MTKSSAGAAGLVARLDAAYAAARVGRHDECRQHLVGLEKGNAQADIDNAIAALYLMIGDADAARRLLGRALTHGPLRGLGLGVQSMLLCAEGKHELSQAVARQWVSASDKLSMVAEDLLVEDSPGYRLPPAHSRYWDRSQKLLTAGRLSDALAAMDVGAESAPHFIPGARRLKTRGGIVVRWAGSRTARLLVLCPDGHGDAFFAWRYFSALQARVDRVALLTTSAAARLLAGLADGVDVLPLDRSAEALRWCTMYVDWWRLPGLAGASLLAGLILLGLVLGLQRRADGGALWGAMGLHGGLVGGWFALQAGPLALAASGPEWLMGDAGAGGANPIGGVIGWLALGGLALLRRRWWA